MRIWEPLKTNYSNNKAQSLTELAAFGSVLLLALSFLVKFGMQYNYGMDLKMRTFRQAMSDAYHNTRRDADAEVIAIEDKHIPDPMDRFGVGEAVTLQDGASFIWGNTLQSPDWGVSELPRISYRINPDTFEDLNNNGFRDSDAFDDIDGDGEWDKDGDPNIIFAFATDGDLDGDSKIDYGDTLIPGAFATDGDLDGDRVFDPGDILRPSFYIDADGDGQFSLHEHLTKDDDGDGEYDSEPFKDLDGDDVYDGPKEYTTAGYNTIGDVSIGYGSTQTTGLWTQILGRPKEFIPWNRMRIYKPEENEFLPPQVMVLLSDNETELLLNAAATDTEALRSFVTAVPVDGEHGGEVWGVVIYDPGRGEINPEYFETYLGQDNYNDGNYDGVADDVTLANRQGLLSDSNTVTTRNDSIRLEEGPSQLKSTDQVNATATMTHTIKKNDDGLDVFQYTVNMGKGMGKIWETPK